MDELTALSRGVNVLLGELPRTDSVIVAVELGQHGLLVASTLLWVLYVFVYELLSTLQKLIGLDRRSALVFTTEKLAHVKVGHSADRFTIDSLFRCASERSHAIDDERHV